MASLEYVRFCSMEEYAAAYKEREAILQGNLTPNQLCVLVMRLQNHSNGYVNTVRVERVGAVRLGALPVDLTFMMPSGEDGPTLVGEVFDGLWNGTPVPVVYSVQVLDGVFRSTGGTDGAGELETETRVSGLHTVDLTEAKQRDREPVLV